MIDDLIQRWGTKMTEKLTTSGSNTILVYNMVPLLLISVFLYVGSAQITFGDLPTCFSSYSI